MIDNERKYDFGYRAEGRGSDREFVCPMPTQHCSERKCSNKVMGLLPDDL